MSVEQKTNKTEKKTRLLILSIIKLVGHTINSRHHFHTTAKTSRFTTDSTKRRKSNKLLSAFETDLLF